MYVHIYIDKERQGNDSMTAMQRAIPFWSIMRQLLYRYIYTITAKSLYIPGLTQHTHSICMYICICRCNMQAVVTLG